MFGLGYIVQNVSTTLSGLGFVPMKSESGNAFVLSYIPVSKIKTDEKNFQNRADKYSAKSVEAIIKAVKNGNFNWFAFDPVLLWKNENGDLIVLSGHSRTEAFRRLSAENPDLEIDGLSFKKIPAKIFKGSFANAKNLALNSNALSTPETLIERAEFYRKQRKNLSSNADIKALRDKALRENQGSVIWDLSYLPENGLALDSLKRFKLQEDSDAAFENFIRAVNIAQWIGKAFQIYKGLSSAHDAELFKFLLKNYGNKSGQYNSFSKLNERLSVLYPRNVKDDKKINEKGEYQNAFGLAIFEKNDDEISELENLKTDSDKAKRELQNKIKDLRGRTTDKAKIFEVVTPYFNEYINNLFQYWQELDRERQRIVDKNQGSLFGLGAIYKQTSLLFPDTANVNKNLITTKGGLQVSIPFKGQSKQLAFDFDAVVKDIKEDLKKAETVEDVEQTQEKVEEINKVLDIVADNIAKALEEQKTESENNSLPDQVFDKLDDVQKIFVGAEVIENRQLDRVQIKFDGIPSAECREELKKNGFRWSPHYAVWQRQLTSQAVQKAYQIVSKYYDEIKVNQLSNNNAGADLSNVEKIDEYYQFKDKIDNILSLNQKYHDIKNDASLISAKTIDFYKKTYYEDDLSEIQSAVLDNILSTIKKLQNEIVAKIWSLNERGFSGTANALLDYLRDKNIFRENHHIWSYYKDNFNNSGTLGKPTIKFEFESNDDLKNFLRENKDNLIDSYIDVSEDSTDLKSLNGFVFSENTAVFNCPMSELNCMGFKPTYKKLSSYDDLIDKAQGGKTLVGYGFETATLEELNNACKYYKQVEKLAAHLKADTPLQSAFNVWYFLHDNILYNYDTEGQEEIRTPARTWQDRFKGVDCDCLAVFSACLLYNMGYKPAFEIVGFNNNDCFSHIFVNLDGLAVDRVLPVFLKRPSGITKTFIMNIPVFELNGGVDMLNDCELSGIFESTLKKVSSKNATTADNVDFQKIQTLLCLQKSDSNAYKLASILMPFVSAIDDNGNYYFSDSTVADYAEKADNIISNLNTSGATKEDFNNFFNDFVSSFREISVECNTAKDAPFVSVTITNAAKPFTVEGNMIEKKLITLNPNFNRIKEAILFLLSINYANLAKKIAVGLLPLDRVINNGYNEEKWDNAKIANAKLFEFWRLLGGDTALLIDNIKDGYYNNLSGCKTLSGVDSIDETITTDIAVERVGKILAVILDWYKDIEPLNIIQNNDNHIVNSVSADSNSLEDNSLLSTNAFIAEQPKISVNNPGLWIVAAAALGLSAVALSKNKK